MEINIDYVLQHGDPRVRRYPLMDTPLATIAFVMTYLVVVKVIGPFVMRNREPFSLRIFMVFYNTVIAVFSGFLFVRFLNVWVKADNIRCPAIDYSTDEDAIQALNTMYLYHISKFVELLDTIFIVLRKKNSQINFLHVFHHASMPIFTWYAVQYCGGGYATLLPMINVFVHIWMYLYYGLAAIGPSMQKYLGWKKYLTSCQLIQFVNTMLFTAQMVAFPVETCNVRSFPVLLQLSQAVIFFILFLHFFRATYFKRPENIKARMLNKKSK